MFRDPTQSERRDFILDNWKEEPTEIYVDLSPGHEVVRLTLGDDAYTICQWKGDEVQEAIEEGLLRTDDWHGSAYEYACRTDRWDPENKIIQAMYNRLEDSYAE
jgi:hypothetical protein